MPLWLKRLLALFIPPIFPYGSHYYYNNIIIIRLLQY